MRSSWLFIIAILIFYSCSQDYYYAEKEDVDNPWSYGELYDFEFNIEDTLSRYDIVLEIDHDFDFSYENLYVKIHTRFPGGEETSDIVSFQLAGEFDQWEGDCNSKKCKVSILLQDNIFFRQIGNHKISIEQYNREENLTGINSLRLGLVDAGD